MRRKLFVPLVVVPLLVVTACGSNNTGGSNAAAGGTPGATTGSGSTAPAAGGPYKITFIQGVRGDEFYVSMDCGARDEAKKLNVTLDTQGPEKWDVTLQTPIVNSVISAKPDAVLIAPVDDTAMTPPLKQLQDGGTKVVLVDTEVKDPSIGVSRIASDNLEGGKEAARQLASMIGDSGKVLVVSTMPGVTTVGAREKGFKDEMAANHPNIKVLGVEYSNNEAAKAAQIVSAKLAANPDLKGIFATNLFSADGSATGLRQAGKQSTVKIVGFDAGPAQIKQLQDGLVQGLVVQKPYDIGVQGIQQAVAALKGEPVQAKIATGFVFATKDNLNDPEINKYLYKSQCS